MMYDPDLKQGNWIINDTNKMVSSVIKGKSLKGKSPENTERKIKLTRMGLHNLFLQKIRNLYLYISRSLSLRIN